MEYSRVEKFQMSPYFTASTLSHNGTEDTPDFPAPPPPIEPSLVAVYTTHGYPLHVSLEDSPCVKATHSLSKLKYY